MIRYEINEEKFKSGLEETLKYCLNLLSEENEEAKDLGKNLFVLIESIACEYGINTRRYCDEYNRQILGDYN